LESDAARLMAIVRAVVDVVGAAQSGQQLQQKARFVRRSAAEVPERLVRRHPLQLRQDSPKRLVPGNRFVVLTSCRQANGLDQTTAVLEIIGGESAELRERVGLPEVLLDSSLQIGGDRLNALLAELGKAPAFVDHAPFLPSHADG